MISSSFIRNHIIQKQTTVFATAVHPMAITSYFEYSALKYAIQIFLTQLGTWEWKEELPIIAAETKLHRQKCTWCNRNVDR